jgi:rhamnosyltransferase
MNQNPDNENGQRVLVLMATFNGATWLDEQISSIVDQSGVQLSWAFADDGSNDATPQRLRHWVDTLPTARVLAPHQTRLGAAGNFLRLLREVVLDGVDYVALSDQDDLWQPGRLQRAIERLRQTQAAGYSSDALAFWADGRRRPLGKAGPQRAHDYLLEPAGPGCTYVLTATLARTLQEELRRTPERFNGIGYHDWLIYAFARTQGQPWIIDAAPGVLYRQHADNELGANFGTSGVKRRWARLRSGWFRSQVLQIGQLWPGTHTHAVARWQRLHWVDRLWLALHVRQLRRRPRDQLALAAMLLLGVLR